MSALVYFWVQPSHGGRSSAKATSGTGVAPRVRRNDSGTPLAPGAEIWLKKYDQQTGELKSEYRSEEYKPIRGGKISVKNAQARFYMGKDPETGIEKVLQIQGQTGTFTGDSKPTKNKNASAEEMRAPTRGDLHDVVLTIFEGTPEKAAMTITMNNASFDSENSTI